MAPLSLVTKLSLAMVGLVVATALSVGLLIYGQTSRVALPLALDSLSDNTGLVASYLDGYLAAPEDDIVAAASMPAVLDYVARADRPSGSGEAPQAAGLTTNVAREFTALLQAKPQYDQLRLIGTANEGREIVRIDRRGPGGRLQRVGEADLQSKARRDYFERIFAEEGDGIYVSPIDYNREDGVVEDPPVPTIRIGKRILLDGVASDYFVILNVDLRPVFRHLGNLDMAEGKIRLVDEAGNYLVNAAAPERVFGFEREKSFTAPQDWPQIAAALDAAEPSVIVAEGANGEAEAIAAWPLLLAGSRRVTLLQSAGVDGLLAAARSSIGTSSLFGAVLCGLIAVLLAVFLATRLVRPIRQLTKAVDDATNGQPVELPTAAGGEVGALARATERYIEREALLFALVRSSHDPVLTKDLDAVITSWNGAAERLYGYTATEAVGSRLDIIIPPDRMEELDRFMAEIRAGRRVGSFRTVRRSKAGERLDVELTISPIRNASGEIIGASTVTRDITRMLQDARSLQRLQAEAAHTSRVTAAGQMAATLAHEINQPLTAVVNYVKALQRLLQDGGMELEAKPLIYARKAIEQSNRASEIVKRVRSFIGNRQTNVSAARLNDIVEDGLAVVFMGREADRILVERDYASDLPEVYVDRTHIQQIVANLTGNALEAMAEMSDRKLTVATRLNGETIVVSFADTGMGVDQSIVERLFEPFTTTKPNGMGFGLNISRSLVEAHGGKLSVQSSRRGAVFEFTLPVGPPISLRH
ncbi:PAS domain S-box protein [Jiella endophytica]|uniref:histidine kinase n=1 Tax=Jiella endophytica TaxID=2558362 RepID=A0A4Y8RBN4_9HYPH|nr:PAS domain S-box protein [Jiella endophytica]TFF18737.1 PAS domain S-box protein [Jiella endophytica]